MTRHTTAATFRFPPMRDGTPHVPASFDATGSVAGGLGAVTDAAVTDAAVDPTRR